MANDSFYKTAVHIQNLGEIHNVRKIWISEKEAVRENRDSDWGELREPYVSESVSLIGGSALLAALNTRHTVSGLSPEQKAKRKFKIYLEATLRSFHKNNPEAVRQNDDGKNETELGALEAFLQEALDREIFEEIGSVPDIIVT